MDAHHVFLAYSKKVTKIFQNLFKNVCTNVSRINIFFRKHQFFSTLAGIDLKFCPREKFSNCRTETAVWVFFYINLSKVYSPICSVFLRIPDIEQEKIGLLSKPFRQDCQNCFLRVRKINPEKKSYLFVSYPFRTLREICVAFVQSFFQQICQKKILYVHGNHTNFSKKRIFFRTKIRL